VETAGQDDTFEKEIKGNLPVKNDHYNTSSVREQQGAFWCGKKLKKFYALCYIVAMDGQFAKFAKGKLIISKKK
jgi:hypothetical protein